jgi:hypothetical protein
MVKKVNIIISHLERGNLVAEVKVYHKDDVEIFDTTIPRAMAFCKEWSSHVWGNTGDCQLSGVVGLTDQEISYLKLN